MCFEPTYEELKQSSAGKTSYPISGFEPTYEELKPFFTFGSVFKREQF